MILIGDIDDLAIFLKNQLRSLNFSNFIKEWKNVEFLDGEISVLLEKLWEKNLFSANKFQIV